MVRLTARTWSRILIDLELESEVRGNYNEEFVIIRANQNIHIKYVNLRINGNISTCIIMLYQ